MLKSSNLFGSSKPTKEKLTVRTLSFQSKTFTDYFRIADLGFCYAPGMSPTSIKKEPELKSIFKSKGISVFNNPANKAKMEIIDLPEENLGSIYHWITLDGKELINIKQVAKHIVELLHYYKLGGKLVYDLEIPSDQIIILGHPDAPVKEQTLEQALQGNEEWGTYVEAVTKYIEPSWIKGIFQLKCEGGNLEFHPVTVTRESILPSSRKFKYNTTIGVR